MAGGHPVADPARPAPGGGRARRAGRLAHGRGRARVDAASGTPTFWRRTLYRDADALARVPLRQITLGGEPVDQAILDQLREVFPSARISWIYASSEVGASIVVHDGRAGFPVDWLDRETPVGRRSPSVTTSWWSPPHTTVPVWLARSVPATGCRCSTSGC
ncbi:hypothetical protein NKG94_20210 [Micromonospora sp. M12]